MAMPASDNNERAGVAGAAKRGGSDCAIQCALWRASGSDRRVHGQSGAWQRATSWRSIP